MADFTFDLDSDKKQLDRNHADLLLESGTVGSKCRGRTVADNHENALELEDPALVVSKLATLPAPGCYWRLRGDVRSGLLSSLDAGSILFLLVTPFVLTLNIPIPLQMPHQNTERELFLSPHPSFITNTIDRG